ncbi:hypothetical protein [Austwickia sp. TVS 96-490-7B]|uniref:hypothetical protein n=1 Tax=Austwickia sp. TVS 96-490-7B TaxID=2830843 RepID=UPI001C571DCE|nr:hypothetical protein [Austwickia sp. TVS 96-490-7B]
METPEDAFADGTMKEQSVLIARFTDEELIVLSREPGVAVFPVLHSMSEDHQKVATQTAYRSLTARGIIQVVDGSEAEWSISFDNGGKIPDETVTFSLPEIISNLIDVRDGASNVVAIARTTAESEQYKYIYVADGAVLEEEVNSTGLHSFSVAEYPYLHKAILSWALHPDASDGSGAPIFCGDPEEIIPPVELLEILGESLVRSDLIIRTDNSENPLLVGLFSGPAGTWMSQVELGSQQQVSIDPVAVELVSQIISELISPMISH